MKLTTKMRYGTRALVDLALHEEQAPVPSGEIAERQQVPVKYLESILVALRNAGLVQTTRGALGGYALARDPASIPLAEVFDALEGPSPLVACTEGAECPRYDGCVTREVWARMYAASRQVLEDTTLADLAGRAREKQQVAGDMYYI
jgi:Rrf2 family protein